MRLLYTKVHFALVFLCSCAVFFAANGQVGTVQLGSGSTTQSYFPLNYNYNYNYSQTIYTAAELSAAGLVAGPITKISYLPTSAVSTEKWRQWTVYLGNSTKQGFDSNSDFVDVTTLNQVFSGNILDNTIANQWFDIAFTSTFIWDGTSNIIVAVKENSSGYGGNPNFASYTLAPATGNRGLTAYRDGLVEIDPATPNATATATLYKHIGNNVAQIKFEGIMATCLPVNALTQANISATGFDVSWTTSGTATDFDVEWGAAGFEPGTGAEIGSETVSQLNTSIGGLTQMTTYHVYVRSNCGGGDLSVWNGPIIVTTTQLPVSVPYYDEFNSDEWVYVQNQTNKWFVGSAAGNPVNGLYISNNNGVGNTYTDNSISVARAMKSFELPAAGALPLKLYFQWAGGGEGTFSFYDYLRVWMVPNGSTLPAAGTQISTSNATGAIQIGQYLLQTSWQTVEVDVDPIFLGTDVKLIFEWRNDSGGGNQPGMAVDNVAFYYDDAVSPVITQSATLPTCTDGTQLTIAETATAPVVFYWQTTATGTSVDNNAETAWTVYENREYFVRAYNTFTGTWSLAEGIEVTNIPTASAPIAPIAASNPACLPGTEIVVINTDPELLYFWQGTNNLSSNNTLSATEPYFVSETGMYYVKSFDPATGCWSLPVGVDVLIETFIPASPVAINDEFSICVGSTSQVLEVEGTVGLIEYVIATNVVNDYEVELPIVVPAIPAGATILSAELHMSNLQLYNGSLFNEVEVSFSGDYTLGITGISTPGASGNTYPLSVLTLPNFPSTAENITLILTEDYDDYDDYDFSEYWDTDVTFGEIKLVINYSIPNVNISWYDEDDNQIATGTSIEAVGSDVMPVATGGVYQFFAEASSGVCVNPVRTLFTVEVINVNVVLEPVAVTCNNGNDGTFNVVDTLCGTAPFTYSVNGGGFEALPTNLTVGTYEIVIQDDLGNLSSPYSITIADALAPSDVVVENITNNTVSVSWEANGTETSWNIEWGLPGFTPGIGEEIGSMVSENNPTTIIDLESSTEYEIAISANCGESTIAGTWTASDAFMTKCDNLDIPFVETFEATSTSVDCWEVTNEVSNGTWGIATGAGNGQVVTAFEGTNNARFTGSTGSSARLVTPTFNVAGQDSVALVFAFAQQYYWGDINTTAVYSKAGAAGTWNQIQNYTSQVNTWTVDTLFVPVTNDTLTLSFVAFDNDGYNNVVDNVQVFPCFIEPGVDSNASVCREEGLIDVSTVISPTAFGGRWVFNAIPTLLTGSVLNVANLADGAYEVLYIVSTPCAADTTVATITVVSTPNAGTDGLINACKNQLIDLFGGLSGTVDFGGTWYAPNGTELTSSYFQTSTMMGQQVYKYVVGNGTCNSDTSSVILNVTNCDYLDIDATASIDNVTVSPNPTTGNFQISGVTSADYTYEILDVNGRVIFESKKITSTITNVNLSNVENGVYLLRIKGNDSERMIRVVKQ